MGRSRQASPVDRHPNDGRKMTIQMTKKVATVSFFVNTWFPGRTT